jgi:hypothetical protein
MNDYAERLAAAARAELAEITSGAKSYLPPEAWQPAPYAARAPLTGVTLAAGPLRDAFERNTAYLTRCFHQPGYCDEGVNNWVDALPASSEGRLLSGAAEALRWGERAELRVIVDTIVAQVKARQRDDGYCLPYDDGCMAAQEVNWLDERRNYDRSALMRGLAAAGRAGNTDALTVLRRFADWLNASPYYPGLLAGHFSGSAHNCNNGHSGSLAAYFSPVGLPEDIVMLERYFAQDFFIEEARKAEALALGFYPLHTPHSYVLLAFQAWLDQYRATGDVKYLEGALGAWRMVKDQYLHTGGTVAICEMGPGEYLPGSYHLSKHTGETCGSVFWAAINHRLLQLFPEEERYAAEIERVICNVILAAQTENGAIRYHNHLHGAKEPPQCANTCCEVMGVPFLARMPQYLYSIAEDGLFVNLYAASRIEWAHGPDTVRLEIDTEMPLGSQVTLLILAAPRGCMALRLRIPHWVAGPVTVRVNGQPFAEGKPGAYLALERVWRDNDCISLALNPSFRVTQYRGADQVTSPAGAATGRYALEYGPILLALVGPQDAAYRQPNGQPCARLAIEPERLPHTLRTVPGQPLRFSIANHPDHFYMPYYLIDRETFTCFPVIAP